MKLQTEGLIIFLSANHLTIFPVEVAKEKTSLE